MGFKGSGKDTVGKHLVRVHGFKQTAFAKPLKQSLAVLMGWPEKDLEGTTVKSREWRESPDPYWSSQLGRNITPRHAMQQFGTEIIRRNVHNDFWVMRTQKLMEQSPGDWVITDVRFPNEVNMIRSMGGVIVRVHRGDAPEWEPTATWIHKQHKWLQPLLLFMNPQVKEIHSSERMWLPCEVDHHVHNNATLTELRAQVDMIVSQI